VWNLATRYLAATLTDQQSAGVEALAFSPADDDMLAVGDSNDSAHAWNEASPHQPRQAACAGRLLWRDISSLQPQRHCTRNGLS
jgi:hypothetical protein